MKNKITKIEVQLAYGIHDDSHIGDIARSTEDGDIADYAVRNRYIVLAGDRYLLTGKILSK